MYQFPYFPPCYLWMMRQIESSYVRVLHASPGAPPVDVYSNGDLIARNHRYRRFTPFLNVEPGQYNIKAYAAGSTANPVIDTSVTLRPNTIYTLAAVGRPPAIELLPVAEPRVPINPSKVNVRFVHLSPNAAAVDITLPDGTVLFSNTGYKGISEYKTLTPGTYTLQARLTGTDNVILTVPNIRLRGGQNISVYAVGLADSTPGLQALIPLDGSTYL